MKLMFDFQIIEVADELVAVPLGQEVSKFSGVIKLNETAAAIMRELKNDITEESLLTCIENKYPDVDYAVLSKYTREFLSELEREDLLVRS